MEDVTQLFTYSIQNSVVACAESGLLLNHTTYLDWLCCAGSYVHVLCGARSMSWTVQWTGQQSSRSALGLRLKKSAAGGNGLHLLGGRWGTTFNLIMTVQQLWLRSCT